MLADPMTPTVPVTVADLTANGTAPAAAPRWRIRHPQVKRVELTGEWAGAWADLVLNPPIAVLSDLQHGADGPRWHLHRIIRAWNFEDAAGDPLPVDAAGVGQLDDATVVALLEAWHRARDLSKSG
jgi:hypothetical protein